MLPNQESPITLLRTNRIEALTDGVFAIVMTLLVFDVRVPIVDTPEALFEGLGKLLPSIFSYALSFIVLGVLWIGHHNQFTYIRRSDRVFLWVNVFFMMTVAFIPFSAGLLSRYGQEQITVIIYGLNIVLSASLLYVHWSYASTNHRLIEGHLPPEVIALAKRRILFQPIMYLIAMALSFINPNLSVLLYVLVPLYYILPSRIDLHFGGRRSK